MKSFEADFEQQWQNSIRKELIQWLNKFQEDDEDSQINDKINECIEQLETKFEEQPPFTLPRISEIIADPGQAGYKLDSSNNILKMFNAIYRLVSVTSTVYDYPNSR